MRRLALLPVVLVLASCGGDGDGTATPTASASETSGGATTAAGLARERLVIETAKGPVEVHAEIADDESERETGLMNRTSLDPDAGMLFVFDGESDSAFWMKDTLIPLSIAFVAADGRIVRILDMEPCRADPCRVYDPQTTYRLALEVNKGAFRDWGVREGDTLRRESG